MYSVIKENKKVLLICAFFFFGILFATSAYIDKAQETYVSAIRQRVEEQKELLKEEIALVQTDRVTKTIEDIIVDCNTTYRARFDEQLSLLSQLKGQDLLEVEQLFYMCGDFYALQKVVMVATIERELEVYEDLISLLTVADSKINTDEFALESWKQIVATEARKSELSLDLVAVLGDIIQGLKNNLTIKSDEMQAMLVEGQKIKEELYALSITQKTDTQESVTP